jgi:dihydropteroate synthase
MSAIHSKLFDFLDIGDNYPTIIMGVLNLSPESFYKGSVEEINRIGPAMEVICKKIPKNVIISVDTQYKDVAQEAYDIALKYNKKEIIINDVSCLKTDSGLVDFIIEYDLPIILMASKKDPGDLLTIEKIIEEFKKTIKELKSKGYDENKIILDPGIGHWVKKKTHTYDLKIINNLNQLRILNKPILVAISRKSFIGGTLNPEDPPKPEDRYNGTLSATAIAVFNGAHIVRTHDVNNQLFEIVKIAEKIRNNH